MENTNIAKRKTARAGFGIIGYLVIMMGIMGSVASMFKLKSHLTWNTHRQIAEAEAFSAAEAAIDRGLFLLQATDDWSDFKDKPSTSWSPLKSGSSDVQIRFSNIASDRVTIEGYGRVKMGSNYVYRAIRARVGQELPEAFSGFALFGNNVGFHNHMEKTGKFTITSPVWSNGDLLWHRGMEMQGDMTAVGGVTIENKPSGLPATITRGKVRDGNPNSSYYAPNFNEPVPEPIPFPDFDIEGAKTFAKENGTYFASASAFESYLDARTETYAERQPYAFPAPIPENPTNTMVLAKGGDATKAANIGIVSKTVIGDPTPGTNFIFFIDGDLTLDGGADTVLQIHNGGIVCTGRLKIARPAEIYAGDTTPAIVGLKKIEITDKDPSDGGGPVNILGILYTPEEAHIHQTHPYNKVAFEGVQVAGKVHNCEFFWFKYRYWEGLQGFSEGAGTQNLTLMGWHEIPVKL